MSAVCLHPHVVQLRTSAVVVTKNAGTKPSGKKCELSRVEFSGVEQHHSEECDICYPEVLQADVSQLPV